MNRGGFLVNKYYSLFVILKMIISIITTITKLAILYISFNTMKKLKNIFRENKRLTHLISLLIISLVGAGTLFFITNFGQTAGSTPRKISLQKKINPIDLHISQYSDKHITINAIDSNGKFSNLALADFMKETGRFPLPSLQVAAVGKAVLGTGAKEYGTWIWTPLMDMTENYIDSTVKAAQTNGINAIYVSVDTYLDIYVMPAGQGKENKKKVFANKLEYFVKEANKYGIAVDAEAGWRNWGEDGNAYKAFAIINFVKEFNNKEIHKLRGFQYDVEPYLLASYKTDQSSALKNYLSLIDQTITLLGTSNLKFSVVIPDFYDQTAELTETFEYNGKTSFTYNHLLDILQNRSGSEIIVMSYRNFATGYDGSIDISNTEVEEATNGMSSVKIIVAQETGDVLPPYITFNNTTKNYYSKEISKINTAFSYYSNFGGIAVHYVNAFFSLK